MKTLLIMRHGKSSWDNATLADHDRPLNPRGKRDAPRMGNLIRDQNLVPDHILSSTAKRARKTAAKAAEACGFQHALELRESLYHASCSDWLQAASEVPGNVDRLLVVGHNPGLEELVETLTGQSEAMPTAALAQVALPIDSWQELFEGIDGQLVELWRPRELA